MGATLLSVLSAWDAPRKTEACIPRLAVGIAMAVTSPTDAVAMEKVTIFFPERISRSFGLLFSTSPTAARGVRRRR
jgi:hypothetical protein